LQVIAYPALYVRCLREFAFCTGVIGELRNTPGAVRAPIAVASSWLSSLEASTLPFRVSLTEDGPRMSPPDSSKPMPNDLTETDLVEDAASMFQYKVEIGGEGSAAGYRRWLEEEYRYSKTFDLLCETIGPEGAYVALPCLVMGAHMSNWPVNGFLGLLAMIAGAGPGVAAALGTDDLWTVIQKAIADPEAPRRTPVPDQHVGTEEEHYMIDREAVLSLAGRWPQHPFTPLVQGAWGRESEIARLRDAMLHPYKAFNRHRRRAADWLNSYMAPMMTFRLLSPAMTIGDTVGFVSPALQNHSGPGVEGLDWSDYLMELLRIKAFAFAAATPFGKERQHNCSHHECAYHRHGLCSRWTFVPARYESCGFPDWLERTTQHSLDLDSGTLLPIQAN